VFDNGLFIGQKIVRLSTGEGKIFSLKTGFIPSDWDEQYRYDVFSFSQKGLAFACETVSGIIERGMEPVFIDEIGPLELQKKGLYAIFHSLIKLKKEVYISARDSCIENILQEFNVEKYEIIRA
jgi:nucleoside-triphosphatase THEP1